MNTEFYNNVIQRIKPVSVNQNISRIFTEDTPKGISTEGVYRSLPTRQQFFPRLIPISGSLYGRGNPPQQSLRIGRELLSFFIFKDLVKDLVMISIKVIGSHFNTVGHLRSLQTDTPANVRRFECLCKLLTI
jgi:hypothetical protein